jgi:hypothetical protein
LIKSYNLKKMILLKKLKINIRGEIGE